MADKQQSGPYKDSDFVKVVDAEGKVQEDSVPKSWVGTHLLPEGWKAASKAQKTGDGDGSGSTDPDALPAKSETRDVLEKYAVEKAGITEEAAKAFANKDELYDAIVAAKS